MIALVDSITSVMIDILIYFEMSLQESCKS